MFPVKEKDLGCVTPNVRAAICATQRFILTQSMDLENSENGQHCHYEEGDLIPLDSLKEIGRGSFGIVDKVKSQISFKEYARKRMERRNRTMDEINRIVAEI